MSTDTPTADKGNAKHRVTQPRILHHTRDHRPLPESWRQHGGHEDVGEDETAFYCTQIADESTIKELWITPTQRQTVERHKVQARYVRRDGRAVVVRQFDAVETDDGTVLPDCVVEDGPGAFPVVLAVDEDDPRELIDEITPSPVDIRVLQTDWGLQVTEEVDA
ncbi:hypothetical protein [Halocalculus aciditolerans]|uniref:Uncharacterized protein n=1 Tax=Halocalculus aciditolerans TaxID=1383812 RepID=A0A830F279_9EURY|nr:hypothetical protein [Halocalculus aciditolerans]GGL55234.1 hypothetical protein GCM10009039_11680 [Halocalculus aciditolerans]